MEKTVFLIMVSGLLSCVSCQYHFVNTTMTWSQAQLYCRVNFGDLATINNKTLLSSAPANWDAPAWIGLYNISWWWSLNGANLFGSTYWDLGQPDNANKNETCVYMSNMMWSDADCDEPQHAVCYDQISNRYILVSDPINFNILSMTWSKAQSYCRSHYTDLATVTDETLMKVQNAILAQSNGQAGLRVWIGLNRGWRWSDQSGSSFRNWDSGEPNGVGLGAPQGIVCGAVKFPSGLWKDDNCDNLHPFICTGAPAVVQSSTPATVGTCLCSPASAPPSQYVFVSILKNWTDARQYCRANYGDLVNITAHTQLALLTSSLPPHWTGQSWIAMYNIDWIWALGDSPLVGSGLWNVGQPNNVNNTQNCVYMSNMKWSVANCDVPQHFVCYNASTNSYILARDSVTFNILSLTWRQAQLYCERQYTELATVTNVTVATVQAAILAQSYGQAGLIVWIGLHRGLRWSDNSTSTSQNWLLPEGNVAAAWTPQGLYCGAADFQAKVLSGDNCADAHTFICSH